MLSTFLPSVQQCWTCLLYRIEWYFLIITLIVIQRKAILWGRIAV